MAFLTQSRFPWLWEQYMFWMGGTVAKRKLARMYLRDDHKKVLEVGCSVGNVGETFFDHPGVRYTGIDIDGAVIDRAQKKYRHRDNVRFICGDLIKFAQSGEKFDFIVYPSMLHHCDDSTCAALLGAGVKLAEPGAEIVISDQLLPGPDDSLYMKFMGKMERGQYVRKQEEFSKLIEGLPFLDVLEFSVHPISLNPLFSRPVGSYNALFRCHAR